MKKILLGLIGLLFAMPVFAGGGGVVDMGTLNWSLYETNTFYANISDKRTDVAGVYTPNHLYCSKYETSLYVLSSMNAAVDKEVTEYASTATRIVIKDTDYTDATAFKQAMSGVYLYYQRTTDETWTAPNQIKIATTAYNTARFSPVVTELNDTIATIRSVVTNTINQTKAIADLQANKQTRPNENCPAGKKCLLVEDNDGTPHWYEIVESAEVQ